ncbi:hypothetical protein Scep_018749 [Stephania cephalantha]|uniref:Uncharacterized protein n=1 Tax=Stephania cephalantha TaxID=152367 RepID=A0AAP0I9N4_9MAGN
MGGCRWCGRSHRCTHSALEVSEEPSSSRRSSAHWLRPAGVWPWAEREREREIDAVERERYGGEWRGGGEHGPRLQRDRSRLASSKWRRKGTDNRSRDSSSEQRGEPKRRASGGRRGAADGGSEDRETSARARGQQLRRDQQQRRRDFGGGAVNDMEQQRGGALSDRSIFDERLDFDVARQRDGFRWIQMDFGVETSIEGHDVALTYIDGRRQMVCSLSGGRGGAQPYRVRWGEEAQTAVPGDRGVGEELADSGFGGDRRQRRRRLDGGARTTWSNGAVARCQTDRSSTRGLTSTWLDDAMDSDGFKWILEWRPPLKAMVRFMLSNLVVI